jgi:hypothetical protein
VSRENDAIARQYGQRTLTALTELVRLTEIGARLVDRGHDWYVGDPENVPGFACESLIIKVGENVSRVDEKFEKDHPEVPWRVIKDMRNRLTHYYEATDYEIVWSTLEVDFPDISAMIRPLLCRAPS